MVAALAASAQTFTRLFQEQLVGANERPLTDGPNLAADFAVLLCPACRLRLGTFTQSDARLGPANIRRYARAG